MRFLRIVLVVAMLAVIGVVVIPNDTDDMFIGPIVRMVHNIDKLIFNQPVTIRLGESSIALFYDETHEKIAWNGQVPELPSARVEQLNWIAFKPERDLELSIIGSQDCYQLRLRETEVLIFWLEGSRTSPLIVVQVWPDILWRMNRESLTPKT